MFGDIDQSDKRVTPIKVHKRFTAQKYDTIDNTSYLGVMSMQAIKPTRGQLHMFRTGSSNHHGPTASFVTGGVTYSKYSWLMYRQLHHQFFNYAGTSNPRSNTTPQPQYVLDQYYKPWGRGGIVSSSNTIRDYETLGLRKVHDQINVFSIPQQLYGEQIKTGSVEIVDYSTNGVITLKDDGYGNLYDSAYETNYLSASLDSKGSGSAVGTVSYTQGIVMVTDTGSYGTVGQGTGANGWKLRWDATKTMYEHEYTVVIPPNSFNRTRNISVTKARSGSLSINQSVAQSGVATLREILPAPAESLYNTTTRHIAATDVANFATHSAFAPYVTTVGLYNDFNELLAVAKLSKPVRNDPELALSFVVRFDI